MKNYSNLYFKIVDKIRNRLVTEEALSEITDELNEYFNCDGVCIFNVDKNKSTGLYEIKSTYGQDSLKKEELIIKFFETYITKYFNEESHLIITNKDCKLTHPELVNLIKELKIKTAILIPIRIENKICGSILFIVKKEIREWDLIEIKHIKAIIENAYYVINNKELSNELKKKEERKKTVKNFLRKFRGIHHIDELKEIVVKDISKLVKSDKCLIRFIKSDSIAFDFDKDVIYLETGDIASISPVFSMDFTKKYFSHLKKGLPICVPNVEKLTNTLYDPDLASLFNNSYSKSTYIFPMVYNEKLTGIIQIDYDQGKQILLTHDVETIMTIVEHVASLIENNRLVSRLKSHIDLENFLTEEDNIVINKKIASKLGLNSAILYSYLLKNSFNSNSSSSNYNNDFIPVPSPKIIEKATFLSTIDQENALLELKYKKLITINELNSNEMHYKLSEKAVLDQFLETNNKTSKIISNKLYIKMSETFNIYNDLYSEEVIEATNMLLKKLAKLKVNDILIHTNLYSTLITTMQDYFQKHNMEDCTTTRFMSNFLDLYLNSEKNCNYVPLNIDDFIFKRFKLFLQYKLKEILFLVTDTKIRCSFLQNFDISVFD